MRLLRASQYEPGPAFDMTPMVDTVFNLLIFFLMATTVAQAEREMRIALPIASGAGPVSANLREIVMNVDADGHIVLAGRQTSPDDLKEIVRAAVAVNPQQRVTVRGDRRAAYGAVVLVLDICKQSGIQEPYLDTVLE
jgi:biopolymer transport protein ExbD